MSKRPRSFIIAAFIFYALAAQYAYAQQPGAERPVVIVGDSQHDHQVHKRIVEAIVRENPVAVFSLGDQVDDGESREQWEIFNDIISPLQAIAKYYPALGNHEKNSALYYENFQLPNNERWYAVKENNTLFIVLDSNASFEIDSEQYRWFENTLIEREGDVDFIVVLFHHPLFTSSVSHLEDEMGWRNTAIPLFEKYGVDIVFSGHSHNYERSFYQGCYYVVSGGGGSQLFDKDRDSEHSQVFIKKYHYCKLQNKNGQLHMSVLDIDGALIDGVKISSKRSQRIKETAAVSVP